MILVDATVLDRDKPEQLIDVFAHLPTQGLLVIASRDAPPVRWRAQAAWSALARVVRLENFDEDETLAYIATRNLAKPHAVALHDVTRGHPLSVALACSYLLESSETDEVHDSWASIGRAVIDEREDLRDALEAVAVVRCAREDVLAALLGSDRASSTFKVLAQLPFVERGVDGLSPLPFVRSALLDDLRWRNPARHQRLEESARQYYVDRLRHRGVAERSALLQDLLYLLEPETPSARFEVRDMQRDPKLRASVVKLLTDDDLEQHEQVERLQQRLEDVHRAYLIGERVVAVRHACALQQADDGEETDYMRGYLEREAPLSVGQWANVTHVWFTEPHDALRVVLFDIGADALEENGATATFVVTSQERCSALLERCGIPVAFESRQRSGQTRHIHTCDWRRTSPEHWLESISNQDPTVTPAAANPYALLAKNEFAGAVRQALRDFNTPSALRANTLLRARLLGDEISTKHDVGHRVAALRKVLRQTSEALGSSPKQERLHRVLVRTYFDAAPSQERAAESLDLPLSTYRRYLKKAVCELVEALWQIELGGPRGQLD